MTSRFSFAPLVFVVFLMVPIYWLFIMSVKSIGEISGAVTFYPHAPTVENFRFILNDPSWFYGYVNATIYV